MRNINFILLLFCFNVYSQNEKLETFQRKKISKADSLVRKGNYNYALSLYNTASLFTEDDNLHEIANRKIDSILPHCRRNHFNSIQGLWKKVYDGFYTPPEHSYDYIEVGLDTIKFFRQNTAQKLVQSRQENISKNSDRVRIFDLECSQLLLSNGEYWNFDVSVEGSEKRLFARRLRDIEGKYYMVSDDRGGIIDPIQRKKALESELYSYYLKVR